MAEGVRRVRLRSAGGDGVVEGWDENRVWLEAEDEEVALPTAGRGEELVLGPLRGTDWRLRVPKGTELVLEVGGGDLILRNLSGRVELQGDSSDVILAGFEGEADLRLGGGDVQLRRVFGALRLVTGSGDIEAKDVKGFAHVETGSGDVELQEFQGELRILTESGDVELDGLLGGGEAWRIATSSGDVRVRLPPDARFELEAKTAHGDLACEFPVEVEERTERVLRGWHGGSPRGRLVVETSSGDISLHRRD